MHFLSLADCQQEEVRGNYLPWNVEASATSSSLLGETDDLHFDTTLRMPPFLSCLCCLLEEESLFV